MDRLQPFYLQRDVDASGVSGTGVVARGVVLPSGKAILEWTTFHTSIAIYNNLQDVETIHGHGGSTKVILGDPIGPKGKKKNDKARSKSTTSSDSL